MSLMLSFLLFFILILSDQKPHVSLIFHGASPRLSLLSQTSPGRTQFFCSTMDNASDISKRITFKDKS